VGAATCFHVALLENEKMKKEKNKKPADFHLLAPFCRCSSCLNDFMNRYLL
jgi:hypothetical protein